MFCHEGVNVPGIRFAVLFAKPRGQVINKLTRIKIDSFLDILNAKLPPCGPHMAERVNYAAVPIVCVALGGDAALRYLVVTVPIGDLQGAG